MKLRKRRVARIRDELRQWLRSRYGLRAQYAQRQIDLGREELGFSGSDDALVAYTLFGADLVPALSDSVSLALSADDVHAIVSMATDCMGEITDFVAGSD